MANDKRKSIDVNVNATSTMPTDLKKDITTVKEATKRVEELRSQLADTQKEIRHLQNQFSKLGDYGASGEYRGLKSGNEEEAKVLMDAIKASREVADSIKAQLKEAYAAGARLHEAKKAKKPNLKKQQRNQEYLAQKKAEIDAIRKAQENFERQQNEENARHRKEMEAIYKQQIAAQKAANQKMEAEAKKSLAQRMKEQKEGEWLFVPTTLDTGFDSSGKQKHDYSFGGKDKKASAAVGKGKTYSTTTAIGAKYKQNFKPNVGAARGTAGHRLLELLGNDNSASSRKALRERIDTGRIDKETQQILSQLYSLTGAKSGFGQQAELNKLFSWLEKYKNVERAGERGRTVAAELPVGFSTVRGGQRYTFGGAIDRIEDMGGGRKAIVDHKTQKREIGFEEIAQQIAYKFAANLNGEKITDIIIDHVPFGDMANAVRYEIQGVTDEIALQVVNAMVDSAQTGKKVDWQKMLEGQVKKVPIERIITDAAGKQVNIQKPVVGDKTSTFGLDYTKGQEKTWSRKANGRIDQGGVSARELETAFWQKHGKDLEAWKGGDVEAGKRFMDAQKVLASEFASMRGGRKDVRFASDWWSEENIQKLRAAKGGDISALEGISAPKLRDVTATTVDGQYIGSYLNNQKDTEALFNKMKAMDATERERVVASIFSHTDYSSGVPVETGHYRDYGEGKREQADWIRKQIQKEGWFGHIPNASSTIDYKYADMDYGDADDIKGTAVDGRWIGNYISHIQDLLTTYNEKKDGSRGDKSKAGKAKAEIQRIIDGLTETVRKTLYDEEGYVREDSEGYAAENAAASIVKRLREIGVDESMYDKLAYYGDPELARAESREQRQGSLARERHNEDIPDSVARRDASSQVEEALDDAVERFAESSEFQGLVHANSESVEVQAVQAGNRMARIVDLKPRIEKLFKPELDKINAKRKKEGLVEYSPEQLVRAVLARSGNQDLYEDYMRSTDVNKKFDEINAQRANKGEKLLTGAERFSILEGMLDPNSAEEGSLLKQIQGVRAALQGGAMGDKGKKLSSKMMETLFSRRLLGRQKRDKNFKYDPSKGILGKIASGTGLGYQEKTLDPKYAKMYAQDQAGIALSDETIYGPVSEQPPVPSVFDELADIEDEYSDYAAIMKKADPTLDDKEIEEYLRYQKALSKLNYMAGEQNGGVGALRKSLATDETGAFTGGFNRSKDANGHTVFGRHENAINSWLSDSEDEKELDRRQQEYDDVVEAITGVDPRTFSKGMGSAFKAAKNTSEASRQLSGVDFTERTKENLEEGLDDAVNQALTGLKNRYNAPELRRKENSDFYDLADVGAEPSQEEKDLQSLYEGDAYSADFKETSDMVKQARQDLIDAGLIKEEQDAKKANVEATKKADTPDIPPDSGNVGRTVVADDSSAGGGGGVVPPSGGGPTNIANGMFSVGQATITVNGETTVNLNGPIAQVNGAPVSGGNKGGDDGLDFFEEQSSIDNSAKKQAEAEARVKNADEAQKTEVSEENQKKSLAEINKLLTQSIALYKEIAKETQKIKLLEDDVTDQGKIQLEEAVARAEELSGMKKQIDSQIAAEREKLTPEKRAEYDANAKIRYQGAKNTVAVQAMRASYDARDSAAKDYERLMNKRLQIESKLDSLQQRRNTSLSQREVYVLEEAIAAQQRLLALNQQDVQVLAQKGHLREEDIKAINAEYNAQRTAQQAQNATNMHGSRNLWDMLGYDIKRSFTMIFDFGVAHRALTALRQKITEVINTVVQLDSVMTDLRIVTNGTAKDTEQLISGYNNLAKQLGTTTQKVAEMSNEWLRQGYSASETQNLVTSSFYLSTLGMMDAGTATEALTSIMKGFKMEASETIDIVDKLTALDLELATSSADIATAMQKTSATAKMAGMSLDELAAAVGVISDVSQAAPESIGTSIRTMLSRYGNVKAGSFESLEGGDDSENLNDIERVLGTIGISIRTASGEMRSFSDVLDDVAEKWVGMSTVEQNAVGTAMAGTRQREAFNVLMENYSTYQEMVKESEESQGTSTKKMEAYYDSIEYSIERLKAAWEEFALSLQSNGAIKGIVDFATFLVENLPKIIQIFATWMAMMNAYKLPVWIKQFGQFINPKARGANGQFVGLRAAFTNSGMTERAMIRDEKWKAQQAGEKFYKKGDMTPVINSAAEKIAQAQGGTTAAIQNLTTIVRQGLHVPSAGSSGAAAQGIGSAPIGDFPGTTGTTGEHLSGDSKQAELIKSKAARKNFKKAQGGAIGRDENNYRVAGKTKRSQNTAKNYQKNVDRTDIAEGYKGMPAHLGVARTKAELESEKKSTGFGKNIMGGAFYSGSLRESVDQKREAVDAAKKKYEALKSTKKDREAQATALEANAAAYRQIGEHDRADALEKSAEELRNQDKVAYADYRAKKKDLDVSNDRLELNYRDQQAGRVRHNNQKYRQLSRREAAKKAAQYQALQEVQSLGVGNVLGQAQISTAAQALSGSKGALRALGITAEEAATMDNAALEEKVKAVQSGGNKNHQKWLGGAIQKVAGLDGDVDVTVMDAKDIVSLVQNSVDAQKTQATDLLNKATGGELNIKNATEEGAKKTVDDLSDSLEGFADVTEEGTHEDGSRVFRNVETGDIMEAGSAGQTGLENAQAMKKARIKTGILTGAMGGVTAGLTAAATQDGSVGDKLIAGATNAVTSGLLSAIPGVGPILGSTLGPIIGGFISDGILKLVHAEELAREARVKEAQEQLEALQSVASSIESLSDSLVNRAEWEAADYKEVNNYISETLSTLRTNKDYREAFLENVASADESLAGMSYSDLVYLIRDGTNEQAQLISNILQSTLDSQTSEATMASQEQERYDARKTLEENELIGAYYVPTSTASSSSYSSDTYSAGMREAMEALEGLSGVEMTTTSEGYRSVSVTGANAAEQLENLEKARAAVEAKAATLTDEDSEYVHQAYEDLLEKLDKHIDAVDEANGEIENLNAEYNDIEIKETFDKTVGMWDSLTISNSTLEEAIQVMAEDLELAGIQVYDAMGNVSTEARQLIEGYLREQDNLSSLFSTDEKTLRKMLKNSTELDSVLASVSEALGEEIDYDDLVDLIEKGGQGGHEEQVKIMQQLGYSGTDENLVEQFNALRNQVYNLNPESLEDFANALGMTVDEVADLKDTMGDTTLADLLATPQENIDKLGEMLDIMNDILDSGKMSSDNFFSILDSYPELLNAYDEAGNLISVSTDNIQKNLLNSLYGSEGGIGKTIGFNMYEDMKTNENLYDSFLEMLEANDKVSQETLDNLKKYNTFTDDAVGFIAADSAAWEQYNALFAGMNINLEEYDDLLQTIMDYQTTMIDQQIDSIQSQKDALDDVNEAREKELDLIKARQKLENAQKEKKLVYREGIGWTYESDQTAIKEAKDEVDKLETEKDQDDLQYQIDQLEAQKAFIEAIPSSMELQEQKETYEDWMNKITENGEAQADILEKTKSLYEGIGQITKDMMTWVENEKKLANSNYQAYNKITTSAMSETESGFNNLSSLTQGTVDYAKQVEENNANLLELENLFRQAGLDPNSDFWLSASYDEAKKKNGALSILGEGEEGEAAWKQLQESFQTYWDYKHGTNTYGGNESGQTWKEQDSQNIFLNLSSTPSLSSGSGWDPSGGDALSLSYQFGTDGAAINSDMATDMFNQGNKGGKETKVLAYNPEEKKWTKVCQEDTIQNHPDEAAELMTGYKEGTIFAVGHTGQSGKDLKYWYKLGGPNAVQLSVGNYSTTKGEAYAKGTLSASGGLSLVNEDGIEGIITPQGTLTSLPARSGVVPADLTKNLYMLGEVAPNIIKTLESRWDVFGNDRSSSTSDDHSTNIGNLYATFQADENFDFDKFLADVKSAINLNRHL